MYKPIKCPANWRDAQNTFQEDLASVNKRPLHHVARLPRGNMKKKKHIPLHYEDDRIINNRSWLVICFVKRSWER